MIEQQFTEREIATILAALRNWQVALPKGVEGYRDIATDGDRFEPLSADEIDELCMKLNCGESS